MVKEKIKVESYLQWVQHSLPRHNDLLRLLLHWEGADQGSNFLSCFPFGQLQKNKQLNKFSKNIMPFMIGKKTGLRNQTLGFQF